MAIGLGGITAFLALSCSTSVRDPRCAFKNLAEIRRQAASTPGRVAFAGLTVLWLAFTGLQRVRPNGTGPGGGTI